MITRKVAATERKTVLKLTDRYRKFSEQRRRLSALEVQLQSRLDQFEKALINKTRKPLGFLPTSSPMSVKTKSPMQTSRDKKT